jgi:hypothetical protein
VTEGNGKPQKRYGAINIGLRGTLAEEYEFRVKENPVAAGVWVRKITQAAFDKDPDLLVKVELHIDDEVRGRGKRYLIGRRSEIGMYPPHW